MRVSGLMVYHICVICWPWDASDSRSELCRQGSQPLRCKSITICRRHPLACCAACMTELGRTCRARWVFPLPQLKSIQPWTFNNPDKTNKAKKIIEEKRAALLIGSPMCTAFSSWQHLNFSKMNALILIPFTCKIIYFFYFSLIHKDESIGDSSF